MEQASPSPIQNLAAVKPAVNAPAARPWQFGLRHLLALMAGVCLAGAGYQSIGPGILCLAIPVLIVACVLFLARQHAAEILAVLIVLALLAGLLLPAIRPPSGPPRRVMCANNLRQISLALQNYRDVYHCFPPAYVADENGKPMHSWRILISQFIRPDIYQKYRFDEPWDGPNNRQFHGTVMSLFECPCDGNLGTGQTSYVAVVGPGTAWPGAKSTKLADIKDGPADTILIVEVHNSGIHWMEPRDLDASLMPKTINAKSGKGISSGHPKCALAARADGSVFVIDEKTPAATVRAMLTIAGGEKVSEP